jgi:hypothetical protein
MFTEPGIADACATEKFTASAGQDDTTNRLWQHSLRGLTYSCVLVGTDGFSWQATI